MWLLTALLLWASIGGHTADTAKAVITLQPPWVNLFQEEKVTLQCEGPHPPENSSTEWYLNNTVFRTSDSSYSIAAARFNDSGEYKCKTALSEQSDPVQLEVHRNWLLLQASSRYFIEGQPLTLRCHGWKNKLVYKMIFYQNGKSFKYSVRRPEITIPKTNMSHNGVYHCSGIGRQRYTSMNVSITVKELFSTPVLKITSPMPILNGSLVSLTCDTQVFEQRPGLQLYFSIHMGNKTLKDRDPSADFQIKNITRADSGLYWCEAATEDESILKRSPDLELQVLELQSPTPILLHVLFCLTVGIIFLVDTVLCVKMQKTLKRKKMWNLEILTSGHEKRHTSSLPKDERVEEIQRLEQEEFLEEAPPEETSGEEMGSSVGGYRAEQPPPTLSAGLTLPQVE